MARPRGHFLWGNLGAHGPDQLSYYSKIRREVGDLVRIEAPRGVAWYFLAHPEDVEQMLLGNFRVYSKGLLWNRVRRVLGNGLLTNDGDLWRDHRRALQPVFHQNFQRDFFLIMNAEIQRMLDRWEPSAADGSVVDIMDEMSRITLQNAGLTLFSTDFGPLYDAMGPDLNFVVQRMNSHNFWKPWTLDPRLRRALSKLHRHIDALVRARREAMKNEGVVPPDILTALLKGSSSTTDKPFSDREIRDEILTFIFVGHETTALSLAWCWSLLGRNPQCGTLAAQEVTDILGDRSPEYDDLERMPYIKNAFLETLRLYPPVWGIARQLTQSITLQGHVVPAKSIVITMPYITQRHPEFWPDPETFDPDRFLPEAVAGRPKYAYHPFGGGPRLCIGVHFAIMEAQLILASVLQRYEVSLAPGNSTELALWATLRPKRGIKVTLKNRTSKCAPTHAA